MKEKKWFNVAAIVLGVVFVILVGVLSFFIVHNAEWLIGDDAILINKTGWGTPFSIWTTIQPELGRFFPLTYMHENIVLLFPGEMHSAAQHYVLNMILFIFIAGRKMTATEIKRFCLYSEPFYWSEVQRRQITSYLFVSRRWCRLLKLLIFLPFFERRKSYGNR